VKHDSSLTHVSGRSEFVDDRARLPGELVLGLILSPVAHGEIISLDAEEALTLPGVRGFFTANDLHHNLWGTIISDQPVLAEKTVRYYGEPIAVLAAESAEALRLAKRKVKLKIRELPPILSINDAITKDSFIAPARTILRGNPDLALASAPHRLQGRLETAGQEHFYLEAQASVAYPDEQGRIVVHSSSQHPTEVQHVVAHALGLKYSEVTCVVKRMGGAFGGKESQASPFAAMAALVVKKTGRPARIMLSRDDDMIVTGKRNPFQIDYDVGFDREGRILALRADLFSDSGAYADLSTSIMERAMLHCDNAYYLPEARITGRVCRLNHAPTTAFRGFGGPQGVAMIENVLEEIARILGKDALEIRKLNCYQGARSTTPYGQTLEEEILPGLFERIARDAEYPLRRAEIERFNAESKTHLRGMSVTAVKFGISFTTRFLNQGSALVNLHLDGTAQVSTGATEMGQGVNTKIALVVAEALGIPIDDVRVMPTSTEKNHNTSPTAASSGSDINGAAAEQAALTIKRRLQLVAIEFFKKPANLRGKMPSVLGKSPEIVIDETQDASYIAISGGFVTNTRNPSERARLKEILEEAYYNRVSLGAYGFYRYPGIHFNKETGQGKPFFYFTNGVACSEVSVDRFTGEIKVLRTDILMDLGRPMIEGIDRGQVTGAFVQGMGWVTTEKLYWNSKGALLTHAPSTYKIPSIQDIPREFNVAFIENTKNTKNIRGSKAVGEPPLLLGISVWTAIKNALSYAPETKPAELPIPATQEAVFFALHGQDA
jgi:xanthine dehydrogenase large subunit